MIIWIACVVRLIAVIAFATVIVAITKTNGVDTTESKQKCGRERKEKYLQFANRTLELHEHLRAFARWQFALVEQLVA